MSKFVKLRKEVEAIDDIDMTPIMSLFVILIPFLLLAAVFVKINVINTPFPQSSASESNNKDNFSLSLYINDKEFMVETVGKKKRKNTQKIPLKENEYQYEILHEKLVEIKKSFPKEYRLNLYPEPSISYDIIVKVMDASRRMAEKDPKIFYKDDEGKKVKQDFLFPDVIWMGILN